MTKPSSITFMPHFWQRAMRRLPNNSKKEIEEDIRLSLARDLYYVQINGRLGTYIMSDSGEMVTVIENNKRQVIHLKPCKTKK